MDQKVLVSTASGDVEVICASQCTVQNIIALVFQELNPNISDSIQECFALRVKLHRSGNYRGVGFLCPKLTLNDILQTYRGAQFSLELKIFRNENLPNFNLNESEANEICKHELYQARQQYAELLKEKLKVPDQETALTLGAIEIVWTKQEDNFTKEVKNYLDILEKRKDLSKFFPSSISNTFKPKELRKEILKVLARVSNADYSRAFLTKLQNVIKYKEEYIPCRFENNRLCHLVISPSHICLRVTPDDTNIKSLDYKYISAIGLTLSSSSSFSSFSSSTTLSNTSSSISNLNSTSNSQVYLLKVEAEGSLGFEVIFDDRQTSDYACHLADKYIRNINFNKVKDALTNGCPFFPLTLSGWTEIDRSQVKLEYQIGNGQFGDVFIGIYNGEHVAVKTCAPGQKPELIEEFLSEAEIMKDLYHVHIIKLLGIIRSKEQINIVMECAELGELRSYLSKHEATLECTKLVSFCSQICSALSYLSSLRIIHRDIAARNILVCSHECVKLSDFGMARRLKPNEDFIICQDSKLPIKWLPPEAFKARRFSLASDVWMFGVCMWEIFSLGAKPFADYSNESVKTTIENNQRLPKPKLCPPLLYEVWQRCWRENPANRFTISDIRMHFNDAKVELARESSRSLIGGLHDSPNATHNRPPPQKPSYPKHLGLQNWDGFTMNQSLPNLIGTNGSVQDLPQSPGSCATIDRVPSKRQTMPPIAVDSPGAGHSSGHSSTPNNSSTNTSKWQSQDIPMPAGSTNSSQKTNSSIQKPNVPPATTTTTTPATTTTTTTSDDIPENRTELIAAIRASSYMTTECIAVFNERIHETPTTSYKHFIRNIGDSLIRLLKLVRAFVGCITSDHAVAIAAHQLTEDLRQLTNSAHVAHQFADVPFLGEFQCRLLADATSLAQHVKSFHDVIESVIVMETTTLSPNPIAATQ